jgi:hypothetical protein
VRRIQRIVALAAVGLLGAIGVTGVLAGPGGVLGGGSSDDSPAAAQSGDVQTPDSLVAESGDTLDGETEVVGDVIDCPAGEDNHFKFEQSASEFEVTGMLVSFDGSTVVVAGPEGDVTATVAVNAEVKGDPQPGDAVKVEGAVLGDGTMVAREIEPACEAEPTPEPTPVVCTPRFEFEQEDGKFEVKGTLVSFDGTTVVVTGPDGDVTASVDSGTEIEGDPQPGDPVEVEGWILGDGSYLAREIERECGDRDDDCDDGDDCDDSSDSNDVEDDDADDHDDEGDDEDHSGPGGDDDDEHDEEDDN